MKFDMTCDDIAAAAACGGRRGVEGVVISGAYLVV